MPELPELEILKSELNAHVVGRRVQEGIISEGKEDGCPVSGLKAAVEGAAIFQVERRGKMLILHLDSGFSLLIHLMMVGQLALSSLCDSERKDVRLILRFVGDELTLGQVALRFVRLVPPPNLTNYPN
jgi:formamidopyrimidine-DNA glycosylase